MRCCASYILQQNIVLAVAHAILLGFSSKLAQKMRIYKEYTVAVEPVRTGFFWLVRTGLFFSGSSNCN
jgi:hypothetical protein